MLRGVKRPKGPEALTVALVGGQILGLARTMLVAALLGTEIQGEAITIGLITGFFSTVLVLNTAWQLVQSKHGNDPDFKASLQGVALARGFVSSAAILVLGWIVLGLFDLSQLRGPLCLIAWIPALEGALSLDAWERLRERSYKSLAFVEVAGPIGSLLAALIALSFTQTVWVIAIATFAGSFSRLVASHILRRGPWRLRVHLRFSRPIIQYSIPLIPAGMFFWINTQSDRILLLLSEQVEGLPPSSLAELGAYGTVASIILMPLALVAKVTRAVVVPRLSTFTSDPAAFNRLFSRFGWRLLTLALVVVSAAGIAGDSAFRLVLGEAFIAGAQVSSILALALGLQVLRMFGYQTGVSRGDTKPQLVGNFSRLSGIIFGVIFLRQGFGLEGLAYSMVLGEIVAIVALAAWLELWQVAHGRWLVVWMAMLVGLSLGTQVIGDLILGDLEPWKRFTITLGIVAFPSFLILRLLKREVSVT